MYYSIFDPPSGLWQRWIADNAIPSVLAPMQKIRAGKTIAIQEMSAQLPKSARFVDMSVLPQGHVFLSADYQAVAVKPQQSECCDTTQIPFWIKVSAVLTAIRLGVAWAEWRHKEEQRKHWQLLQDMNMRLLEARA